MKFTSTKGLENITYLDSMPSLSYEVKVKNRKMLVAFFTDQDDYFGETVISTYIKFANTWKPVHQLNLETCKIIGGLDFFEDKAKGLEYVYFEYYTAGGTAGNAVFTFALYDALNNKLYELPYNGFANFKVDFDQVRDGEFEFKKLMEYPEILKLLEYKASKSKNIYRPE